MLKPRVRARVYINRCGFFTRVRNRDPGTGKRDGKRMRLRIWGILAGFLLSGGGLFAGSLGELLDSGLAEVLKTGERPLEIQFGKPLPLLVPGHEGVKGAVEAIRAGLEPGIMVETLRLYVKPEAADKTAWTEAERISLYNEALALSTLAGLEYYSPSRNAMRVFYETSSVIDGPSSKKALADPVCGAPLPAELTVYARQKDLTFGDNIYRYDYRVMPGAFMFVQENLTTMTAGIIPAVRKNKLRSAVAVIDAGEYILVYAVSMAKAASFPGIRDRIGNSFSSRAEAILTWFAAQADKAFTKVYR
jgi:hypothetical protein